MMRALALMLWLAGPVAAEDIALHDSMVLDQCLATGLADGCIGLLARQCEGDQGAMARGLCLGAETALWRQRAEDALAVLATREAEVTALATRRGVALPSLAAIQTSFAAYAEATCAFAEAQWDGVHAGWEWAECQLRLTADHARGLQRLVEALE